MKETIREKAIQECIDLVVKLTRPNCKEHTPFKGACVSCGSYENPDVIDPDELLLELGLLKKQTPRPRHKAKLRYEKSKKNFEETPKCH